MTDQEIADWLTANARAGTFSADYVAALAPVQRVEVLSWIAEEAMRAELRRGEMKGWLRAFSVGDGREALRASDPGAR